MARNRVTPFGTIEDLPGRGLLMGNRGILTGSRRWATKAWIACVLEFRGWRASDSKYTPLFFTDEAVALAAGHRPCALCRRADHRRFRDAWGPMALPAIDATLHAERTAARPTVPSSDVPPFAMVSVGERAHLVVDGGGMRPWSMTGYGPVDALPSTVTLLTPPSLVDVLWRGYEPLVHGSAA